MEENEVQDMDDNKYIKLENKEPFQVLLITPNRMNELDWIKPNYLKTILSAPYCKYTMIDPKEYVSHIATLLEISKYPYPDAKVTVISEETDYIKEIIYLDIIPECRTIELVNDFGTMLNTNGDTIYGNVIVTRTKLDSNDELNKSNMYNVDVTNINMEHMLYKRANTSVITYDCDNDATSIREVESCYTETAVFGSLDKFAEKFFGNSIYTIKKLEFGFLKHNINIWYSEDKYGNLDVCGDFLPDLCRVDKMIVFTLWNENYRGNLTLDEFNKIKFLSKKMDKYIVPEDIDKEEYDHLNRVIIKTKDRILNTIYNIYKK